MCVLGLDTPWKLFGFAVRANHLKRKGDYRHQPKKSAFLMLKSGSPINWCSKPHENHNGGYAFFGSRLTLKMCRTVVKDNRMHSQGIDGRWEEGFTFFTLDYGSPKQIVCYSTRNSSIWWVCVLKSLFDLENRSYLLWRSTGCIAKLLTNIHKKNWNFDIGIQITKKLCSIAHEDHLNWGNARFVARLILKIVQTGRHG